MPGARSGTSSKRTWSIALQELREAARELALAHDVVGPRVARRGDQVLARMVYVADDHDVPRLRGGLDRPDRVHRVQRGAGEIDEQHVRLLFRDVLGDGS